LDALRGDERNNYVGNHIYGPICNTFGEENAPTITGMLLDESAVDFKQLLNDNNYFVAKAKEAFALLMHSKNLE